MDAHALARDVVGQPARGEVERAAPALLVGGAQLVDPAHLQRRQNGERDDEHRRQHEEPMPAHLPPSLHARLAPNVRRNALFTPLTKRLRRLDERASTDRYLESSLAARRNTT